MNEQFEKASEMNTNNLSTSDYCSTIVKPAENSDILFSEIKLEDSSIYQHDPADYLQLPAFYRHLPIQMKNAAISVNKLTNIPYDALAAYLLGVINCAVQIRYDVNPMLYDPKPTSLYISLLLPTGAMKSSLEKMMMREVFKYQEDMQAKLKPALLQYKRDLKVYDKQEAQWVAASVNSNNPAPPPSPPTPVQQAEYVQTSFTIGGFRDLLKAQPFAWIITPEAGEIFNGHAFQDMNGQRSMEWVIVLAKLWSADHISSLIKGQQWNNIGRRVNMITMAQSRVLEKVLNNEDFQQQGFIHRILITQSSNVIKPEVVQTVDYHLNRDKLKRLIEPFHNRMRKLFNAGHTIDRAYPDEFRLKMETISMSKQADHLMTMLYNRTRLWGQPDNLLKDFTGFADRAHEHAARIAANIAVFRGNEQIEEEDAQAAIDMLMMFIDQRLNMEFDLKNDDNQLTQGAKSLLKYFEQHKGEEFTKGKLRSSCGVVRPEKMSYDRFEKIVDELVLNGQIVVLSRGRTVKFRWATEQEQVMLEANDQIIDESVVKVL